MELFICSQSRDNREINYNFKSGRNSTNNKVQLFYFINEKVRLMLGN